MKPDLKEFHVHQEFCIEELFVLIEEEDDDSKSEEETTIDGDIGLREKV